MAQGPSIPFGLVQDVQLRPAGNMPRGGGKAPSGGGARSQSSGRAPRIRLVGHHSPHLDVPELPDDQPRAGRVYLSSSCHTHRSRRSGYQPPGRHQAGQARARCPQVLNGSSCPGLSSAIGWPVVWPPGSGPHGWSLVMPARCAIRRPAAMTSAPALLAVQSIPRLRDVPYGPHPRLIGHRPALPRPPRWCHRMACRSVKPAARERPSARRGGLAGNG